MREALRHNYPAWQDDPHGEDGGDSREVWFGAMRVVSPKRARVLRKRGVPLMPLHAVREVQASTLLGGRRYEPTTPNGRARYAWFECKDDAERRKYRRGAACYNTHRDAEAGLCGRKAWLQERLEDQRADYAAHAYFRRGAKLAATLFYQTHTHYKLRAEGTLRAADEYAANPQLDLYAKAYRAMFGVMPEPEVATGAALDALCKVHGMPAHWTNEQRRHYIQHGYVVEEGHGDPAAQDMRRTPQLVAFVHIPGVLQREDETDREFVQRHLAAGNVPEPPIYNAGVPTHFEVCPTCLLVPVLCRCKGDALAG